KQPLPGEMVGERLRARIGEHPSHLAVEDLRLPELALRRQVQKLVVGNAAPQKERQPRGQLDVADRIRDASRDVARIALDAEQEGWADEQTLQADFNATLEAPFGASVFIERHQRLEVLVGYRTP